MSDDNKAALRSEGQLIQSIVNQWIHLDNLAWRNTQTLIFIEGGCFAASYPFFPSISSALINLITIVIVIALFFVTDKLVDHKAANNNLLDALIRNSIHPDIIEEAKVDRNRPFLLAAPHIQTHLPGRRFRRLFFAIAILINIGATILSFRYASLQPDSPLVDRIIYQYFCSG